jgi:error-prone DNA polymerase
VQSPVMPRSEHVLADYQMLRLSLKGDPMEFLRDVFKSERALTCAQVGQANDGSRAKCAGVILVRQMPGTAGIVFITLRDEIGICNVVVWPSVFEEYRREVMASRVLLIEGKIQHSPEGVVHLVSERLYDRSVELYRLSEDRFRHRMHDDQIPPPPESREMHRHPRNVRVLPKSRDFH